MELFGIIVATAAAGFIPGLAMHYAVKFQSRTTSVMLWVAWLIGAGILLHGAATSIGWDPLLYMLGLGFLCVPSALGMAVGSFTGRRSRTLDAVPQEPIPVPPLPQHTVPKKGA